MYSSLVQLRRASGYISSLLSACLYLFSPQVKIIRGSSQPPIFEASVILNRRRGKHPLINYKRSIPQHSLPVTPVTLSKHWSCILAQKLDSFLFLFLISFCSPPPFSLSFFLIKWAKHEHILIVNKIGLGIITVWHGHVLTEIWNHYELLWEHHHIDRILVLPSKVEMYTPATHS